MKPETIFIYRHGESIANVDWTNYCKMEDSDIPLSFKGKFQSFYTALKLLAIINSPTVALYNSPFLRVVQTAEYVKRAFDDRITIEREDSSLRELCWAPRDSVPDQVKQDFQRKIMKSFDGKIPGGESARDVYKRLDNFINNLYRDFQSSSYPKTTIIISHGIAIKCLLMKWANINLEDYENVKHPKNCQLINLKLQPKTDTYTLMSNTYELFDTT